MPFLENLLDIRDIRYHNYYRDIPSGVYKSTDNFTQFPGLPGIYPGERFVQENMAAIARASNEYWYYSIYLSMIYVVTIFSLQYLLSNRQQGFDLKRELILWNWALCFFSLMGTIRCLPEFIHVIRKHGFVYSYTQSTYAQDIRLNAWYWFFSLSKAPELIDTLFIVLRKRRLIKLHWIHHILTLVYSWFVFGDVPSTARWMVNMNLFVHTLMYGYYAWTAMGHKLPRQVNITLTTLQIVQMMFGFYIHIDCLRRKLSGLPCDLGLSVAVSGFLLYLLFFVLFMNFFIRTYIIPSTKKMVNRFTTNKIKEGDLNNNPNGAISNGHLKTESKKLQ